MAKRKKRPDAARQLCKLGTLAHNRAFTPSELRQYAGSASAIPLFKRKGWIKSIEKRRLYPTKKGWRAIELACALTRRSR